MHELRPQPVQDADVVKDGLSLNVTGSVGAVAARAAAQFVTFPWWTFQRSGRMNVSAILWASAEIG